jgi:hypothetical protein
MEGDNKEICNEGSLDRQEPVHDVRQTKINSIKRQANNIKHPPSHDRRTSSVFAFCASILENADSAVRETTKKSISAARNNGGCIVSIFVRRN